VVERPASVVKELVENAIDAGASTIRVEIEAGGKRLIRVRDDGVGMDRQDAERSLLRHATSKLRSADDLEQVGTHGFRGEALPSIASVAHLVLRTRDGSSPAGTEIEVRHGAAPVVRDVGHPVGTTVEVRDLFGSVPARRKFLKADGTEAGHVSEALTLLALARPQTGFTLLSAGRELLRAPAAADAAARVFQLFGAAFLGALAPVDRDEGSLRVRGFVSRAEHARQSRASLRLFVNGRAVRDRGLSRALTEGGRAAGIGEFRGDAILFLDVPPHMVDVNVHPAKTEVRFADARTAWAAVERGVRDALSSSARIAPVATALPAAGTPPEGADRRGRERAQLSGFTWTGGAVAEQAPAFVSERGRELVLGQHRNTYIVATDGEELVLYDQHTAHERARFEQVRTALAAGSAPSQGLLLPAVVTLPPRLRPLFDEAQDALAGCGYDVEPFGADTLRVRAVPSALAGRDPGPALVDLLRDLLERGDTEWAVAGTQHRLAATIACHSAVRGGQPLALPLMQAIVRDLERTEQPALCPHGRPTRVRVPKDDMARWFQRTGWTRS
jgi:DNA mismatch repair protein MutL